MENGISGKIANAFIKSKLSVLLFIAFMLLGLFSLYLIPREEEPQIDVPMADIMVGYPGASPEEVESRIMQPLEKVVSNVKGVEHVYSTSMNDMGMLTVQFYVGEDVERSLVKLYNEIMKNMDRMPQGATMPLVKSRAIDDVPALAYTLWSEEMGDYQLRQVAEVVGDEIKKIPDVAQVNVVGGQSREVKVMLDKDKMAQSKLDFGAITQALQANNSQMQSGNIITGDMVYSVQTGSFFADVEEVRNLIVGTNDNQPVYLYQIAEIEDGPEVPKQYVSFGYGAASKDKKGAMPDDYSAVTISIAKKKGADAMQLAEIVSDKVEHLKKEVITNDVHVEITRNYGETASYKVFELLSHLSIAIVIVTLFVMLAMGWRGGLVVFLSVPVTFALTLFAYYFLGYTLNRITLFALVFVTGIVTDDSIVIAENMHRHFKMKKLPPLQAALYAINEVGNPTILATLTVIAAVLPMAFVSGMMGPYMSPMPIGASIAMTFSLIIALTLTPYFGYLFLRHKDKRGKKSKKQEEKDSDLRETKMYRLYAKTITPFLENRKYRWGFMIGLTVILLATFSLFYTKAVPVKMLPFDNKNEFQVVIDMPEGTTLERTAAVTKELAVYLSRNEKVTNYQTYVGTSAPISFNGLVRHYDMRMGDNIADIQVNLIGKGERSEQSHDIASSVRADLQAIAKKYNANVKVVEVPPGPPVMSTIVAEIYGPDYEQQIDVARQIKDILAATDNVADVDWSVEDTQIEYKFEVDKDKAMRLGIPNAQVVQNLRAALSGMSVGVLHRPASVQQIGIVLQLPETEKASLEDVLNMKVVNQQGLAVPISDIVTVTQDEKAKSIQRKDQKRVVFVLTEVAGDLESPIYPITAVSDKLSEIKLPEGYTLSEEYSEQPKYEDNFALKWDGEWQITYEVFRDLGLAFMLVLIIIYILIVAWFQNFITPLVQLAAIPLSLIGIILGHWAFGAYFSAPSMIGFIALAGIMVRNSVLLIDFIDIRLKDGIPLKQAVIESGAVRTIPIILTAGGVVLGAIVMLFDPIFQGLAISLLGGTITSTVLTLIVVPLLYFKMLKKKVK
ncbi:multidrug efflux pump subunit AcrB [Parabacteroides sp. PF5-5]|uniref:efflux RND transporter permease subunit n=1 Tax=unclassified Parabacteroides TaxID=2649774 RepID=UPI0024752780|nr:MULTISPECIES: efflux RND transporter permease subunit [unclassified Parabacteroides]MDH6304010.1 multidrug efflux pump subunit AcrB [Parabacteroides sp. PH5-39]MDH6315275.1 multidrug efflux pump subunit AcrB [Parabacteroides sp. PF5-13]MDH6318935.1 multidrug efflux pump subunit AcrB [Parabacteroides sp. PH5-13]MDH6322664.1 multidrug efflux pump subunit AcrB [Parabacteroides sp. PH5-8]MDH6326199.1 multidrug efflux pump subunit AcrB [Parabacteroides sp. PH5-41]